MAYDDYIEFHPLGPRTKFRIVRDTCEGAVESLSVVNGTGDKLGPERAKIVISTRNGQPRLLMKDEEYNEWIEPETFYPFSSSVFYEEEHNNYRDPSGYTIEAINAPVWHGVPSIGLKFTTASETLIFSGDTAHDTELWHALHTEKRPQRLKTSVLEFERAGIIYGDINDYIERVWSAGRYFEALRAFENAVVIHDIATHKSVVHTDYRRLQHTVLHKENVILTHSPDKMTSEWALSKAEKTFCIRGRRFFEVVGDKQWLMNADIYHKERGRYFVGYKNPLGTTTLYENDGILNLGGRWNWENGTEVYKLNLYEDIAGQYVPVLADESGSRYVERPDGRVELVTFSENGSQGTIMEDQRARLAG